MLLCDPLVTLGDSAACDANASGLRAWCALGQVCAASERGVRLWPVTCVCHVRVCDAGTPSERGCHCCAAVCDLLGRGV